MRTSSAEIYRGRGRWGDTTRVEHRALTRQLADLAQGELNMSLTINTSITGNLTKDAHVVKREDGKGYLTFITVAVNRGYVDANGDFQEKAEFFDIAARSKNEPSKAQYLVKGRRVEMLHSTFGLSARHETFETKDGEQAEADRITLWTSMRNVHFAGPMPKGEENAENVPF